MKLSLWKPLSLFPPRLGNYRCDWPQCRLSLRESGVSGAHFRGAKGDNDKFTAYPRTKGESHNMHLRSRASRDFRRAKGDRSVAYRALALLLVVMIPMVAFANDEIPGPPQIKPIVLVGGTVHTISGDTIADGMVLFEKGRITAVGKGLALPANVQKIEVQGKHVYPSFLDAHTQLGLVEISSIRATIDSREVGSFNPNVESAVALNPDSELLPVARANGILLALAAPTGGMISGRSSLIQLDGWTFEDLVVRKDIGMHLRWPSEPSSSSDDSSEKSSSTPETSTQSLRRFFEQARAYQKARAAEPGKHAIDLRLDAMLPVLEKKLPVIVEADELRQIQAAVGFALEHQIRIIIYGGYDAADCAPLLIAHQIPVIIGGTYRLPMRESDAYDASYTLPDRLRRLGVEYCIASVGKFAGTGVRNLPYHVANAAAFGLPVEDALKSITLYPAQILGVADRIGSLDTGKDATLFVCTGDPLDVDSSIEIAFVQGRRIELNDRHKRLWQKYEQKYQATGGAKRR